MTIQRIQDRLRQEPLRRLKEGYVAKAAVLMSIVERPSGPGFLLTKRSHQVATHKGQVSFPGGYQEGRESLQETALRETEEELGIGPAHVRVLGSFHEYLAVTDALVRPYVGILQGDWQLSPNPQEVDSVFEVPMDFFRTTEPLVRPYQSSRGSGRIYSWDFEGRNIWGLTAAIIKDFMEMLSS
ncbi:MAG: CoA pyrophosphatase [Acidobacteriota bacterium]